MKTARRSLTVVTAAEMSCGWPLSGELWGTPVDLERSERGSTRWAVSVVWKRPGLSVGEAHCVEVVDATSGGYGFHARDWMLAYCTDSLGRGLPQLEHGVLGEPIDLAPFNGVVLGAGKKELEYLRVGSREALAHACG